MTTYNFSNVSVGTTANDGTGDELRTAFIKINTNFNYISSYGFNSADINVTGNIVASSNVTAAQLNGNVVGTITGSTNGYTVGYLDVPQNDQGTNNYVLTTGDRGKHILSNVAVKANIFIPNNASTIWTTGTSIMIVNHGEGSANIIANTGVTLYLAGNSITDSNARTLGAHGIATLLNISANLWYISGTSIT